MTGVNVRFDLRSAPGGAPFSALYPASVEIARWADRLALDAVVLSEHHVSEDGYMPSPIPLAAAIATTTERVMISISAIVAPLWNPIRLAEDLATLDLLAAAAPAPSSSSATDLWSSPSWAPTGHLGGPGSKRSSPCCGRRGPVSRSSSRARPCGCSPRRPPQAVRSC